MKRPDSNVPRRSFLAAGAAAVTTAGLARHRLALDLVARAAAVAPAGHDLEAVEHVVIAMQENRSFDHYFGTFPGVRGFDDRPRRGLGVFSQPSPDGNILPFELDDASAMPQCAGSGTVPIHSWAPQHESWNDGKLNGFVRSHVKYNGAEQGPLVMGYFTRADLPFYFGLADAFTICDAYHSSVIGPTMPNRLYGLSATIDPSGKDGGPVIATPDLGGAAAAVGSVRWETMFERLLDSKVSWKFYQQRGTSVGPDQGESFAIGFNALLYFEQYLEDPGSDLYKNAFLPVWPDEFAADVANGTLPQVSWIYPPLMDSEHPSAAPTNGENHVSTVLSTLVSNPDV